MRAGLTVVAAAAVVALAGAPTASANATCTWGGTPAAATGENQMGGSLTNTPSTQPIHFHATGPLGGECQGTLAFDGFMDAGATCGYITFHAHVYGLRDVKSVVGTSVAGVAPARLYDAAGQVVGSENAQFLSDPTIALACNTAEGLTHNPFSSVIELFGDHL